MRMRVSPGGGVPDRHIHPRSTEHFTINGGEDELEAIVTVEPSGRFEEYLELGFRWARDGRFSREGRPDLLRGAAFADAYRTTSSTRTRRASSSGS